VSFELQIGWRYLYKGRGSRAAYLGIAVGLLACAINMAILLTSNGASPWGVIGLIGAMLVTSVSILVALFNVFNLVSVLGVVFGVAALTVVLAVTTGFERQFREKVLGVNAHVIIMKNTTDFKEYRSVMQTAARIDPDVLAVQPFIFAEMLVTRGHGEVSGVAIKGVDPERVTSVLDLEKHMIEGSVASLREQPADGTPSPTILGKELARKIKAKVGDEITVVVPLSNFDFDTMEVKGAAPKTRKFTVAGIFYSGFDEYDRRLMYTSLRETQELIGKGDQVMGVELKVRDVDRADQIANKLGSALREPPYVIQDWYELNHNLFTALKLQKLVLTIVLTLIIFVAMFNMIAALTMMVTDKTREIAILKSMGATTAAVGRVFQLVGLGIGAAGTILGLAIGLTICHVVSNYGYHLDPKVYLIDRLPIAVRPIEVILVTAITMSISLLATLWPSSRASALRPVDGLRYD
jgi:lipoprotein-releasing system permease protein